MKLKRLLTILLAIAALGSAAACNGDKDSEKSEAYPKKAQRKPPLLKKHPALKDKPFIGCPIMT